MADLCVMLSCLKPAWTDEHETMSVTSMLDRYASAPAWIEKGLQHMVQRQQRAELDLLGRSGNLLDTRSVLAQGYLMLWKLPPLNSATPSQRGANSVWFHPHKPQLILVGSMDQSVRVFELAKKGPATVKKSVHIAGIPCQRAHWSPSGSCFYVVSNHARRGLAIVDTETEATQHIQLPIAWENPHRFRPAPTGDYLAFATSKGKITITSTSSCQPICTLHMNEAAVDVSWDPLDSNYMYSCGEGMIYCWDMRQRKAVSVAIDHASQQCHCISVHDQLLAVGSNMGVVNVYTKPSDGEFGSRRPVPVKSFDNLTTEVDTVRWNHTGEILAFASSAKRHSLRLAHFPSATVFQNFPTEQALKRQVLTVDFSSNSEHLVVGEHTGLVQHFRLRHYANQAKTADRDDSDASDASQHEAAGPDADMLDITAAQGGPGNAPASDTSSDESDRQSASDMDEDSST